LGDLVAQIPMAALVAVMIMVSVGTFNWHSVAPSTLKQMPKTETFVMVSTVLVVIFTHNLAIGVIVGIVLEMVMFARRVAHFAETSRVIEVINGVSTACYTVRGELFFASSNDLTTQFEYLDDPKNIVIDFSGAHIWDPSTVAALDSILDKYHRLGKDVEIKGMNDYSSGLYGRLGGQLGGE
jgi:sulfate permease, SulP family